MCGSDFHTFSEPVYALLPSKCVLCPYLIDKFVDIFGLLLLQF